MPAYHQMGHDSQNLLDEQELNAYSGAIISPVNYPEHKVAAQIEQYGSESFEMILDPQLYYPNSQRGHLPTWTYFPADVDTADQSSSSWWKEVAARLAEVVQRLRPAAVCSPAVVPRVYSDQYYDINVRIASDLQTQVAPGGIEVIQTLLAKLADLSNAARAPEIASIVSRGSIDRIFLVFTANMHPRRELNETEDLKGAMALIGYLQGAGMRVVVGYSSSDLILWKSAGAKDCATGKFFNLRRFTPSRWDEAAEGGGQLPYWFEESLMGYLREADLLRVRDAGLVSDSSTANPYSQQILERLDSQPGEAWLGLSWRQYLYWFADFERRCRTSVIRPNDFLRHAEHAWSALDSNDILMEERQNDGAWLRSWRRAILEWCGR